MAVFSESDRLPSAWEIAESVRAGRITARKVLEVFLDRVHRLNPGLNAIVTLAEDDARVAADAADRRAAQGHFDGPLHGVPFTVKDSIATRGLRTTAGSLLLADHVPAEDAPVVARLRAAGAILMGKTNCPEFALDMHTTNRLFGPTRNPLNLAFTSGGSSGGESAAVAAGLSAFGIGTDFGGSIRWPAHCTGLASLRATPGLIPSTGMLPYPGLREPPGRLPAPNSMSMLGQLHVIAPIARSVTDLRILLQVMAGPDGRDVHTVPVTLGDPARVDLSQLAIAWCDGEGTFPVRSDLVCTVQEAASYLASTGMKVDRRRPPGLEAALSIYSAMRAADGLQDVAELAAGREEKLTPGIQEWLSGNPTRGLTTNSKATVAEYKRAAAQRDALRAQVLTLFESFPLLLLPPAGIPAFEIGPGAGPGPLSFTIEGVSVPRYGILGCCAAVTLLALPAAVVPIGRTHDGLPIGVQVVGRPFADHEVQAVAMALERGFGGQIVQGGFHV